MSSNCGIYVSETLRVESGSISGNGGVGVFAEQVNAKSTIGVRANKIIVSGGTLEGTACDTTNVTDSTSYGVLSESIEVSGNGKIIGIGGKAKKSAGVYASNGSVTVGGGSITGTGDKASATLGESYGLYAASSLTLNSGRLAG